jgi:hypothetical protein
MTGADRESSQLVMRFLIDIADFGSIPVRGVSEGESRVVLNPQYLARIFRPAGDYGRS